MTVKTSAAVDHALVQLVRDVLPVWMRHLAGSCGQSQEAVHQMLAAFGELTPLLPSGSKHDAAQAPGGDPVERMFQGFQYEDRVAQIMALLQQDMQRMQSALAAADTSIDASQWLARLESGYVMQEQREQHLGSSHDKPASGSDETTFF